MTSRYIYLGRENLLDRSTFAACLSAAFNTQELVFNAYMYIVKTEIIGHCLEKNICQSATHLLILIDSPLPRQRDLDNQR